MKLFVFSEKCPTPWLSPDYTHCEELLVDGAEGLICRDGNGF